uniref:Heme haloperoxidase family profile domain-containing protein n=1 Tax=Globisporangium ultimum (strain ATCC 200006 / CBS 805.95 / DAOM BR144) TaxID=431595 RepID=K3WD30_GLOUD
MVSASSVALVATITSAAIAGPASVADAQATVAPALMVGDYYRPSGSTVSGVPGTTAAYRRSPCPALNTLANHGYIPRNGQSVTRADLKAGIMNVYNIGVGVADILVSQVPETLSLDYLGTHNLIEHDASLVHYDAYLGKDPSAVDPALLADFLDRANSDGLLTLSDVAAVRKQRAATCRAVNPDCDLGVKPQSLAFLESSVLLRALGGFNNESISRSFAQSFLEQEKIPSDYQKPATDVSLVKLLDTTAKLKLFSIF